MKISGKETSIITWLFEAIIENNSSVSSILEAIGNRDNEITSYIDVIKHLVDFRRADVLEVCNLEIEEENISICVSSIRLAVMLNRKEAVQFLMQRGAVSNDEDPKTLAILAAELDHSEVLRVLFDNGADFSSREDGYGPLMAAIDNENGVNVSWILHETKNSGIDLADHSGVTPLLKAVMKGNLAIVECLLSNGADIEKLYSNERFMEERGAIGEEMLLFIESSFAKVHNNEQSIKLRSMAFDDEYENLSSDRSISREGDLSSESIGDRKLSINSALSDNFFERAGISEVRRDKPRNSPESDPSTFGNIAKYFACKVIGGSAKVHVSDGR